MTINIINTTRAKMSLSEVKKIISESSSVNEVDEQEKNLISAEANRIGVREAAKKYGLTWQRVASWKKSGSIDLW